MPSRAAGLDQRVDLVRLALADQVAHARRGHEHLGRDAAALAVGGRQQRLGDDALEADRELRADLALLGGREDVDDAVDRSAARPGCGAWRRRGGRSRPRSAPCRSSPWSRISPTRITSGSWRSAAFRPAAKLGASWPISRWLTMQRLWRVQELDRVLDREDVLVARLVDLVDQRRERGRLAGAGRAGHEHDAARLLGELAHDRRQAELLDRHRLGRDQAERGAERAALEEGVDAEAADARDASRRSRAASRSRAPGAARSSRGSRRRSRACRSASGSACPRAGPASRGRGSWAERPR